MNTTFLRRARISFFVGSATILLGLTASACDSSPAQPGQATTTPIPTSTAASSTHTDAPAAPVPGTSTPDAHAAGAGTKSPRPPAPAPEPLLGTVWGDGQEGYGTAHPETIFNGGDPTGWVTGVHWQSWGGPVAIGTGMASDARNTTVAEAPHRKATVHAFNLGVCKGKLTYQAIEWYFPSQGDKFDPHHYINICTGEYVGPQ